MDKVCSNFNMLFYIKIAIIFNCVYSTYGWSSQSNDPEIVLLDGWVDHVRERRDAAIPTTPVAAVPPPILVSTTNATVVAANSSDGYHVVNASSTTITSNATQANVTAQTNTTDNNINKTTKSTSVSPTAAPPLVVTRIPLLGVNGSGQYHGNLSNITHNVSEPSVPDDDTTPIDVFKETPDRIKAEQNITIWKTDNHTYYSSEFLVGNISLFNEHWANITTPKHEIHSVLSDSHRRAATLKLPFDFEFYGNPVPGITVATGGFIFTGDHVHNWLAATQYIAPLMANFDTRFDNNSLVKLYEDDEKFTALWENVSLQENRDMRFTFAVTLYKNGDIIFAYKDVPCPISSINDTDHPVKIGISDAYLTDRIAIHVRTKTIYEYHRVSFRSYEITNNTILKLIAQPTCLQYDSCDSCVNHNTAFNCSWCEQIKKCSSGTDRNKQNWLLRNCDKIQISNESFCPAPTNSSNMNSNTTSYQTDSRDNPQHNTIFRTSSDEIPTKDTDGGLKTPKHAPVTTPQESHSAIGGVVSVFIVVALISSLAAWVLYAFKNPHTRSGQLLIKYRPSQWSWRRGEARYTAATIHM